MVSEHHIGAKVEKTYQAPIFDAATLLFSNALEISSLTKLLCSHGGLFIDMTIDWVYSCIACGYCPALNCS